MANNGEDTDSFSHSYRMFTIVRLLYNRPKKPSPKYARFKVIPILIGPSKKPTRGRGTWSGNLAVSVMYAIYRHGLRSLDWAYFGDDP